MSNAVVLAETVAPVLTFAFDGEISEDTKLKFRSVTEKAMERAVKNVLATDKALKAYEGKTYEMVLDLSIMAIDSLSRDMRDKLEISDKVDEKGIAAAATKAVSAVKRELCINLVWNGFPVYTNGVQGANFVRSLPSRSTQQENIKRAQAERYVDAAKFHEGKPLVKPNGKTATREDKMLYAASSNAELVDYIKVAASLAGKVVSWLWINHRGIFDNLATRVSPDHVKAHDSDIGPFVDLNDADREVISTKVSDKFGATLGEVKGSFVQPKSEGKSRFESFVEWFKKESMESRSEILKELQTINSSLSRSADNAKKSFGVVTIVADDLIESEAA